MMDKPSLTIDSLNLHLPAGYDHRAEFIAREVGRELSRLPLQQQVQLLAVTLPGIQVNGGESDRVIARRIARAIHRQVTLAQSASRDATVGFAAVPGRSGNNTSMR
jgi:hypothetical protein